MLFILSVTNVSCGVLKRSEVVETPIESNTNNTKTNKRTPGAVWRNSGNHNRGWARTYPANSGYTDEKDFDEKKTPATDDEWKKLDIKLGRNDNKALYKEIKSWLGTPYAGGGHQKQVGTDCSGFVMELYLNVYNMRIERRGSLMYYNNCEPISKDALREGDLVFFHDGSGSRISHVGIYLRDNKFAHASSSRGVVIDDLNAKYYVNHFYAAGRVKRQ